MSFGVCFRINSGCKMFLSVQQCTRSTVVRNEKYLFCRDYNIFTKSPEFSPVVTFSKHTPKGQIFFKEAWRSDAFCKRQNLVPLGSNSYSDGNVPKCEKKEEKKEKLSLSKKFKKMYAEYWYVLIPVHALTSSIWFGSFYYLAVSGYDILGALENLGAPSSWIENLRNSKAGNLVLAYTLFKVATPARYGVTIGGTTISINILRRYGLIKPVPVPTRETLKQVFFKKKGALSNLKATCQDKMQVTKNEFLKTKNEMQKHLREANEELHNSVKGSRADFKELVEGVADDCRIISKGLKSSVKKGWDDISGGKNK